MYILKTMRFIIHLSGLTLLHLIFNPGTKKRGKSSKKGTREKTERGRGEKET